MNRTIWTCLALCMCMACNTLDDTTEPDPESNSNSETMSGVAPETDTSMMTGNVPLPGNGNVDIPPQSPTDMPDEDNADTAGGGAPPPSGMSSPQCMAMCEYLDMCNSCFYDEVGNCLDIPGCAAVCDREVIPSISSCVGSLQTCDEAAFQGCYDENIGDDDCANTCRFLEECEECFFDDSGECLSIAGCTVVCRTSTPPAAAACIAQLDDCGSITGCFEQ